MARRRTKNLDLPPRVYLRHGAYYYAHRPDQNGKQAWTRLDTDRARALAVYGRMLQIETPTETMGDLIRRYLSDVAPLKKKVTYEDNLKQSQKLLAVFGDMEPRAIKPHHVARYLDLRGKSATRRANLEIALLSHVFTKGMAWGVVDGNPCRGVERHPEPRRTRYITDEEFAACQALAGPAIAAMMEFALLTGMRQRDMLALRLVDCTDAGIEHAQSKTGKRLRFNWSRELRETCERIAALKVTKEAKASPYLFARRNGSPFSQDGFRTVWQRVQVKFAETGKERFTWHDIRAKCLTDADRQGQDAQAIAGHANRSMTERYIKARRVETVDPLKRNLAGRG